MRATPLFSTVLLGALLLAPLSSALAAKGDDSPGGATKEEKKAEKAETRRRMIDEMARETLDRLFRESDRAKAMFEEAAGYAVFDNLNTAFLLATGKGSGVAVRKSDGRRTYMQMGSVGVNLGYGIQKCQVVFLFRSSRRMDDFVEKGWEADASASAAAGNKGANIGASWINELAVWQFTEKGLMVSADVSGTKYWKSKNLNQ